MNELNNNKKYSEMTKEELVLCFRLRCTMQKINFKDATIGKSYADTSGNLFEPTSVQFSKFMNGYIMDNDQIYTNYLRTWLEDENNSLSVER
jgi:hypothetical protein